MLKKNLKLLVAIFIIIATLLSFSVCFAETAGENAKAVTTSETAETTENAEEEEEQEIYNGDLYLIDNNIVMDKLVDGNVFLIGQNVEITGQINGNLFVIANKLTFNNCYVRYSVFACANSVNYNGACNDLYVSTNNLELTYDSYVVRDVKAVSKDVIFKAAIGRDVDLICNNVNFGENDDTSIIYGKLRYSANTEAVIPEGVVTSQDSVTYTKPTLSSDNKTVSNITDILVDFLISIVTVVVIYLLSKLFASNFSEKVCNNNLNILRTFIIGLVAFIAVIIISLILLLTQVGIKLAFILVLLFALLCLLAIPALTIKIANILKPVLKIEKTSIFYLVLALVSIVLYGITLIPVVGSLLNIILKLIGIGILIDLAIPHKELSEEEKLAIKEAKEKAKADKEAKKQQKLEAKEAKKQEKADKSE